MVPSHTGNESASAVFLPEGSLVSKNASQGWSGWVIWILGSRTGGPVEGLRAFRCAFMDCDWEGLGVGGGTTAPRTSVLDAFATLSSCLTRHRRP